MRKAGLGHQGGPRRSSCRGFPSAGSAGVLYNKSRKTAGLPGALWSRRATRLCRKQGHRAGGGRRNRESVELPDTRQRPGRAEVGLTQGKGKPHQDPLLTSRAGSRPSCDHAACLPQSHGEGAFPPLRGHRCLPAPQQVHGQGLQAAASRGLGTDPTAALKPIWGVLFAAPGAGKHKFAGPSSAWEARSDAAAPWWNAAHLSKGT